MCEKMKALVRSTGWKLITGIGVVLALVLIWWLGTRPGGELIHAGIDASSDAMIREVIECVFMDEHGSEQIAFESRIDGQWLVFEDSETGEKKRVPMSHVRECSKHLHEQKPSQVP